MSLAGWPFSLKLLWAPFVDTLYVRSWGRRKTWLVPVQLLLGVVLLLVSQNLDEWASAADEIVIGADGTPVASAEGASKIKG